MTPFSLAALHASSVIVATSSLNAGVIPVKWNQSTPSNISDQLKSSGFASAMAECARS